jgi:hypothetical protein
MQDSAREQLKLNVFLGRDLRAVWCEYLKASPEDLPIEARTELAWDRLAWWINSVS